MQGGYFSAKLCNAIDSMKIILDKKASEKKK